MLKIFLHDQIKILLERMETHPEEFLAGTKWDEFLPVELSTRLVSPRFKHFTKLEQYLIRKKYKSIVAASLRQRAYDGILETLVFKEEPTTTERYYSTSNHPLVGTPFTGGSVSITAPTNTTGTTLTSNTLTVGKETLDAETIKHMKEHIKAFHKEEIRKALKAGGK